MTETFAVSPFGGRGMAHAQISAQRAIARAASGAKPRGESGDKKAVDKWKLIRAVTEAKQHLGLSDRTICVLEALLSFLPERELKASTRLIVFPSNAELSVRARGMAPATLRRHLASLVSAGLVMRRDSANGKRYARRNEDGEVEQAFGFDISQLVLRSDEIFAEAIRVRRTASEMKALRSEVTIHMRDMRTMLNALGEEGHEGLAELEDAFEAVSGRLGRRTSREELEARLARLVALRLRLEACLGLGHQDAGEDAEADMDTLSVTPQTDSETGDDDQEKQVQEKVEAQTAEALNSRKVSANVRQNERHIKKPESESLLEERQKDLGVRDARHQPRPPKVDSCQRGEGDAASSARNVTLPSLLKSCPSIADYATAGIQSWQDLFKAGDVVRRMLGVSDHGWFAACAALGQVGAAIAMAVILQRAERIASPGGYLRSLTAKAQRGALDLRVLVDQELRNQAGAVTLGVGHA
ncbi:plasmid replication protein RepC [Nitratireductor basaltis]|uniref:Replication initiation protein RepC n=1 Tax=Nitratireductor basaltis TaxID=472175 RepID=A0A084U5G9_9HYPH|nr:plasmid replication protein RepC [Nitratireductor basaltis]KFB08205.1 Replication initiation protein RepC [Nitratireductor basaltis]